MPLEIEASEKASFISMPIRLPRTVVVYLVCI